MGNLISYLIGWRPAPSANENEDERNLLDDLCVKIQAEETDMAIEMLHMITDVDKLSRDFNLSPLHLVAETGNTRILQVLLNKKANVNICDCRLFTPLHLAAGSAHADCTFMMKLIEAGADINARDIWGKTPFHRATIYKHRTATNILIDANCDVNIQDEEGRTVLMYLAHYPYWPQRMVDKVIGKSEVNINLSDKHGRSALYYAVLSRQLKLVEILFRRGANLEDPKPVKLAVEKFFIDCLHILLKNGARIDTKSVSLLEIATRRLSSFEVQQKNSLMLKMLLQANGQRLTINIIRKIILFQLNQQATIPGLQNIQTIDISWIVPIIQLLLSANSISLQTLQPLLIAFDHYDLLKDVKASLPYDGIPPLSFFCRTEIRNTLACRNPNIYASVSQLTSLPVVMRDFLMMTEFA